MASPSNNTSVSEWWENIIAPMAPASVLGSQSTPVQGVPSHVSIASSHTLSSAGTLPMVPQAPRGYEPKPAQAGGPSTSMRPHDLGTIPEGKVRSVVTAFNLDRQPPSAAGTIYRTNSPPRTLTPREEYQQEVPRHQNELSMELERVYGADWKTVSPQGQGDPYADEQAELQTLRMQKEALLRETIDREADLRKFLSEHSMQTESLQEAQRVYGDGQTLGLPNPSVVTTLLHGGSQTVPNQGVQQQGVASQGDQLQFEQAYEHFKRTGCAPVQNATVPVPQMSVPYVPEGLYGEMPTMTVQENLLLPDILPAPTMSAIPPPPGPTSYLLQASPKTAMFPTIDQLRAPSSSSLPSTNCNKQTVTVTVRWHQ
eukprot:4192572-Amphidinium_carterae.2